MAEQNTQNQTENTGNTGQTNKPQQFEIAVLPLQNTTLFPDTVVPLAVGRERSSRAVEAALATEEKLIACVTIKTPGTNGSDAKPIDLYEVGTIVQHQAHDAQRRRDAADRPGRRPRAHSVLGE
jgi:ATP-dependent Lon protease